MARYLLTGAAGFIGSYVARRLLADGHQVVGMDNLNQAYDPRLKDWRLEQFEGETDFTFKRIDISEMEHLRDAWGTEPYDAVINLAARAGVRPSVKDPWIYFRSNLTGTINLLELCRQRGVHKFVLASTSSLYGAHAERPFRETADISRPLSPYAASKGAAEMLAHTHHHLWGTDVTVLRYFTVYGPAGRPDMSIFRFIQWIAEGRPVVVYGDGHQERDFTFVEDIARGTVAALKPLGFEVINLGSDQPYELLDVIHRIEAMLGKEANIDWQEKAPADVRATWACIDKAGDLLGWEPSMSLDQGLKACVDWYLRERDWASRVVTVD